MAEEPQHTFQITPKIRLAMVTMASIIGLLIVAYFAVLRLNFDVLYSNLPTDDAALVVQELESREIRYKLSDGGNTISVPANQADATRLSINGSDVSLKSLSGFELFNEAEMGLTDFAQKIKFQRALQGELARTIMMMEDISKARVHLAIPEQSLFRGQQSKPKASVTLIASNGVELSQTRIVGIQRLVASAIPELTLPRVVVLDNQGSIVSQESLVLVYEDESEINGANLSQAEIKKLRATEKRNRSEGQIAELIPDKGARGFSDEIVQEAALKPKGGVSLSDLSIARSSEATIVTASQKPSTYRANKGTQFWVGVKEALLGNPFWLALTALLVVLTALIVRKLSRRTLSREEHEAFAETLRNKLNAQGDATDANFA